MVQLLGFWLVSLSQNLHAPDLEPSMRMSKQEFRDNLAGVNGVAGASGSGNLSKTWLDTLHKRIEQDQMVTDPDIYADNNLFNRIDCEGWLSKVAATGPTAAIGLPSKRFFVLCDSHLFYFTSPKHTEPRGHYELDDTVHIVKTLGKKTQIEIIAAEDGRHGAVLSRSTSAKPQRGDRDILLLRAMNEADATKWMRMLTRATLTAAPNQAKIRPNAPRGGGYLPDSDDDADAELLREDGGPLAEGAKNKKKKKKAKE